MSKRLQVSLDETELSEIQAAARRQRMTTSEWVRQTLRTARHVEPRSPKEEKLEAVRASARYSFPAPDIRQMLAEVERGYLNQKQR